MRYVVKRISEVSDFSRYTVDNVDDAYVSIDGEYVLLKLDAPPLDDEETIGLQEMHSLLQTPEWKEDNPYEL
jgi:hypothetical protein